MTVRALIQIRTHTGTSIGSVWVMGVFHGEGEQSLRLSVYMGGGRHCEGGQFLFVKVDKVCS